MQKVPVGALSLISIKSEVHTCTRPTCQGFSIKRCQLSAPVVTKPLIYRSLGCVLREGALWL